MADSNVNIIQDPYSQNQPGQGGSSNSQTGASPVAPVDPGAASGQGGGSAGTGGAAPGAGSASTSKTGTGFVNIQNVLNANKGSGQQLGNAIGSGINGQVSNVGQQLGQAQQTFGAQAQAGTVGSANDQSTAQNIINSITGYSSPSVNTVGSGSTSTTPPTNTGTTSYQSAGAAPANGPNGFPTTQNSDANPWTPAQISAYQASNPNPAAGQNLSTPLDAGLTGSQVSQFGTLLAGNYTGPQGLSNIDALNQQAQQVQALGQNVNTSGGQQQLLQQFIGGNNANYGAGAQGLDQLLLGQGGAQPLQSAAQNTLALPGQISGAQNAAQNTAAEDTALSSQFGAGLKSQLNAAQAGILSPAQQLSQNATANDTAISNEYNKIQGLLANTTVPANLSATGETLSQSNALAALAALPGLGGGANALTPAQAQQLQTLISGGGAVNPNTGQAYSLAQLGIDPSTLIKNNLTNTAAQGNTTSAFLSPSQQAQLNAISQLQGQSQNTNTQNVPIYQADTGGLNYNNLINQIDQNPLLTAGAPAAPASPGGTPGQTGGQMIAPALNVIAPGAGNYLQDPTNAVNHTIQTLLPGINVPAVSIGGWSLAHGGIVPHVPKYNKLSKVLSGKR